MDVRVATWLNSQRHDAIHLPDEGPTMLRMLPFKIRFASPSTRRDFTNEIGFPLFESSRDRGCNQTDQYAGPRFATYRGRELRVF